MATEPMYIIRGLDVDGREMFYTGKAGTAWVSDVRSASFGYVSQHIAREKAKLFNTRTLLHGLRFVAIPYSGQDQE